MSSSSPESTKAFSSGLEAKLNKLADSVNKSKTMQNDQSQPPTPDGTGKPANFHTIAPGLYRSSYPQHVHFEQLEDLELKTIITLVPENLPLDYADWISSNGIVHHQIHVLANKDENVYTDVETINKVLSILLEPANYPLLLHCNKGKHRTGCMTACFRKVTGWPIEDCLEEYLKYSTPKSRDLDKAFIERFDPSALKPLALERGFVGGVYGPHLFASTQSSLYSNATAETDSTISSQKQNCTNDYHEKAFRQTAADLESMRLWSHK